MLNWDDQYVGNSAIVGSSRAIMAALAMLRTLAATSLPVLIHGETGTGKQLFAHELHTRSARSSKPFVTVDCSTLPESIVESELFGAKKGAYTGSESDRTGLIEAAEGGTVFLDEVGELPQAVQPKLLRVVESSEIRRIGDSNYRKVDVRFIAATNRNLKTAVENKTFRLDLYHRLAVAEVVVPPLRDRAEDIPALINHFVRSAERMLGKSLQVSEADLDKAKKYTWPGNVRELQHLIQRSAALTTDGKIRISDLGDLDGRIQETYNLKMLERQTIKRALEVTNGNKLEACKLLGLGKTTLYRKLSELDS